MILDTENISFLRDSTVIPIPPGRPSIPPNLIAGSDAQLDHRVAQLEATVRAQSAELRALRMLLMNMGTVLRMYEGDGR